MKATRLVSTCAHRFGWSVLIGVFLYLPAQAYNVDSTADAPDANPGDSVCQTASAECTLRAAIEESNASAGLDWVTLDDKTYLRSIASEFEIADDLGITSPGDNPATIDAAGLGRILHVQPGVSVNLNNLVLRGGADNSAEGGAAIFNEGDLDLYRVAVFENTGSTAAGIRNTGTLNVERSLIGYNGPGAALLNDGSVDIEHSAISVNDGVGLENRRNATLNFAEITHNAGGGIVNASLTVLLPASVDIVSSVLAWNTAGGALQNTGSAALRRSTVSGNRGENASAILMTSGTLALENVTIAFNGSPVSPAPALAGGGTIRVINTIIGDNVSSTGDPNCQVIVTSLGHNVMSCPLDAPDPTTSTEEARLAVIRQVPVLWPSGGYTTFMHAPLPGSPAIDNGACIGWPDQRGADRPQGAGCDIGATEITPLCTGGVEMTETRMTIKLLATGSTKIKLRGQLLFTDPLTPVVDPLANGLQFRIENVAGAEDALVDRTLWTDPLVGEQFGCGGWRAGGGGTSFRWASTLSGPPCQFGTGQLKVTLKNRRASSGGVDLKVSAKGLMPDLSDPVRVTVVLDGTPTGGDWASNNGACAQHVFQCTSNLAGTSYHCE